MHWFVQWYKQKKNHYLFPLFTAIVGMVGGMLLTPTIGVIGIALSLYLALVIFLPWHKIKWDRKLHLIMPYIISIIISCVIILPISKYLITIFPSYNPYKQLIRTVTATVEVYVDSKENGKGHILDKGGYLIFAKGKEALLITSASESYEKQIDENTILYRGIFNMDASSDVTQQKVHFLKQAEYIQIGFSRLKKMQIKDGKAIVIINSNIRCEFIIPSQHMNNNFIIIPNIQRNLNCLAKN